MSIPDCSEPATIEVEQEVSPAGPWRSIVLCETHYTAYIDDHAATIERLREAGVFDAGGNGR